MSERKIATTLEPGTYLVDKYLIRNKLGGGGMGQVFEAIQKPIDRPVAIKVLHPKYVADEQVQQRFLQEAQAASQLSHPNTITIYDFGRTRDDLYFIAMEYVEGRSLADVLHQNGPLPLDEAIPLVIQVAQSLGEAHRKGIIHRDLKPDNIMVIPSHDGPVRVKVLDFGIAKLVDNSAGLTQTGSVFGTPGYMAPEQARGKEVEPSADFYALTCCLYELLTGQLPYTGESVVEILMQHQEGDVPTLDDSFPPSVNLFLRRALSKDPASRPQSADDYIAGLMGGFVDDSADGHSFQPAGPASSGGFFAPNQTGGTPSRPDSETRRGGTPGDSHVETPDAVDDQGIQDDFRKFVEQADTADDSLDRPTVESDLSGAAVVDTSNAEADSSDSSTGTDTGPAEPGQPSQPPGPEQTPSQEDSPETTGTGSEEEDTWSLGPKTGLAAAAILLAGGIVVGTYTAGSADGETPAAATYADQDKMTLSVTSQPDGAVVTLDDSRVGVTPVDIRIPRDKPLSLKVEKEGYETVRRQSVRASSFSQERFFADLAEKTLALTVTTPVPRAALTVNNESYGRLRADRARTLQLDWPESTLSVELDAPGYEPYVTKVPTAALEETLDIAPKRSDLVPRAGNDAGHDL